MSLKHDSKVVKVGNLLSAGLEGETVLMNIQTGNYFGLDSLGAEVLQHLEVPVTIDALSRTLEAEFDADAATIREDLLYLFNQMLEYGLIEVVA